LLNYIEFIKKINESGFRNRFTNYIDPNIFVFGAEGSQAYTGDPETDSGKWGLRAAHEKKLAYGYFFNGAPDGFIAPRFYSIFIDAFKPRMTVEERYESGKLGIYEWMVWNVFTALEPPVGWSQIWQYHKIKDASERRQLDAALKNLQMSFDVAVNHRMENI
jgi:hypothetical protein